MYPSQRPTTEQRLITILASGILIGVAVAAAGADAGWSGLKVGVAAFVAGAFWGMLMEYLLP